MGPPHLPEDADCFEIFLTFWQGFFWLITCAYCCTSCASPERTRDRDAARRAARYDSSSSEEGFARRPGPPLPPQSQSQFGAQSYQGHSQGYPPHPQSAYPPQQFYHQHQGPPPQAPSHYAPSKDSRRERERERDGMRDERRDRERERDREHRKKRTQEDDDVEKALRESAREAEQGRAAGHPQPPARTDTNLTQSDVQSPPPYRW